MHSDQIALMLLAAALLPGLLCGPALAQKGGDIWGKPIAKQPFDEKPFREIKPADWLWDVYNNIYCTSLTKDFDEAKELGSQIGELNFVTPQYVYYDSQYLKAHDPKAEPDQAENMLREYKKRGIRAISAHGPWLQAEIWMEHPEWRAVPTPDGKIPEVDMKVSPHGGPLCQLGPWGDRQIDILCEILTKFPEVDGFNFDGIHHGGPCYCQSCRENYRKETGGEIPSADMSDAEFRRYLLWQDRMLERYVERMQTRLKAIKPDVAIVTYTTNAGRFGHLLEIPHCMSARTNLLFDAIDHEFWADETNRGTTVVPSIANEIVWAVSNHRVALSTPYLMTHGNPYGTDSFPGHEYVRRAMLTLTHGAYPAMTLVWPNNKESGVQAVRELNRRAPWITHKKPEPWAALVLGDYNRQFYGRDPAKVEERYLSNVFGAYRTALEEHLPVTIINEWNLNNEDLKRFRLLVLANTACLSDEQAEAVRGFVRNGGGLVASVDASLLDELGNPRQNFALADVFGAHYGGVPSAEGGKGEELDVNFLKGLPADYWEKRKYIFDLAAGTSSIPDDPRLKAYTGGNPVTFKGQAVLVEAAEGAETAATIAVREQGSKPSPAVVANRFGQGRAVYLACGLDSAYYLYPYPYQRLMLAQAMRWAAGEQPGVSVNAPMCVQSTFFRQTKDGERLVVHLFNNINSNGNYAKPEDDVPLTEETVPVHDIRVRFSGYKLGRIHLEPEGLTLTPVTVEGGMEVTVPKLEMHSMVVAELAE